MKNNRNRHSKVCGIMADSPMQKLARYIVLV